MWFFSVLYLLLVSAFVHSLDEGCEKVGNVTGNAKKTIQVTGTGNFYTPGYEEHRKYPNFIVCIYSLEAPENQHIRLKFNDFDLEATDQCQQADMFSVYDFHEQPYGTLQLIACGPQKPRDYVSKSNKLQFYFVTNAFAVNRGINITYSLQDNADLCSSGETECRNRKCVPADKVCDGNDNCGDGTDEEKCNNIPLGDTECGRPSIDPLTGTTFDRIVGGQEVKPGSWPWMADLQYNVVEPNGHVCGGSLINAQWVLSAAHCFMQLRSPKQWRIRLGNHNKYKDDEYEQVRYGERIVIWDDILPQVFEGNGEFDIVNDVALIKLNAPVKFTSHVKPVCLPDMNLQLNITSKCYATGWGATRGSGSSNVLKQAYHPIQDDRLCSRLVGNQFQPNTMICAGSMAPANGVCHGDSGGPLVCETKKNQWSIAGVASYVTEGNYIHGLCGLKGRPSVFNRISVKLDYIQRMIDQYS